MNNTEGTGMEKIYKHTLLLLLCSLLFNACNTNTIKTSTVKVYKFDGSISCNQSSGVSLEDMRAELMRSKVPIVSASCGSDGLVRAAVCGIETGRVNVFEIPAEAYSKARALGYHDLSNLDDFTSVSCGS